MKSTIYILLGLLSIIISCNNNHLQNSKTIMVNLEDYASVEQNNIFSKIEVVQLEMSEKSIVGRCDKLIVFKDDYYILDKNEGAILVFNTKGDFRYKIHQIGKGPGEYDRLEDFNINSLNNSIELLVHWPCRLLQFDMQGSYIEEIVLPSELRTSSYFTSLDCSTRLLYSSFANAQVYSFNRDNDNVKELLPKIPEWIPRKTLFNPGSSVFYQYGSETKYKPVFSNNVYVFNNGRMDLKFAWDFGKYNFDIFKDIRNDEERSYYMDFFKNQKKYALYFYYTLENTSKIFTSFIFNSQNYKMMYNKNDSTYQIISNLPIGGHPYMTEDCIISIEDYIHLKNIEIKKELVDNESIKTLSQNKEGDNPVVLKLYPNP